MFMTLLASLVALAIGCKLGSEYGRQAESRRNKMKLLDVPGVKIARRSESFLHSEQQSAWEIGMTLGNRQVDWLGTVIVLYGPEPFIFLPDDNPILVTVDPDSAIGDWTFYPPSWLLPFYEGLSPRVPQTPPSRYVRQEAASRRSD